MTEGASPRGGVWGPAQPIALLGTLLLLSGIAAGATEAGFYEGKRITMLVNFSVGGPTDIEGRLVAKHLSKHIPGNPRIIVKNVPGAGGIAGTNYMAEVAKPDGLTVGHFSLPLFEHLMKDPGLSADITAFGWLGGSGHPQICSIRRDAGTGVNGVDDLLKLEGFRAAATRPTTSTAIKIRMALDLLGADYRLVTGYKGFANVVAGVLQNEVQFFCASTVGFRQNADPVLIKPGHAVPLWYFSAVGSEGEPVRDPSLEGIPTFIDVYARLKGGQPSGRLYRAFELLNNVSVSLLRASLVPAGTPDEALQTLRLAWRALERDEEFAAEYRRMFKAPANLMQAPAVEALVEEASGISPSTLAFINQFIDR